MSAAVSEIRADLCRAAQCPHALDYSDPCAACPEGHWQRWTADCTAHAALAADSLPAVPIAAKAGHAVAAAFRWALSGFPVANQAQAADRIAICRACPFWAEDGNGGFGECRHHRCGCTKAKTLLATERCPIGKW